MMGWEDVPSEEGFDAGQEVRPREDVGWHREGW
jgi:hypothetical protein